MVHRLSRGGPLHRSLGALDTCARRVLRHPPPPQVMTLGLFIGGVIIFALVVMGSGSCNTRGRARCPRCGAGARSGGGERGSRQRGRATTELPPRPPARTARWPAVLDPVRGLAPASCAASRSRPGGRVPWGRAVDTPGSRPTRRQPPEDAWREAPGDRNGHQTNTVVLDCLAELAPVVRAEPVLEVSGQVHECIGLLARGGGPREPGRVQLAVAPGDRIRLELALPGDEAAEPPRRSTSCASKATFSAEWKRISWSAVQGASKKSRTLACPKILFTKCSRSPGS